MKLGDAHTDRVRFTEADLEGFGELIGVDLSHEHALPEPLIAACFSKILGMDLPGPGANYLKQEIDFLAPAPLGSAFDARAEITRLRPEKALCDLATTFSEADGRPVAAGRALILIADVAR